MLYSHPGLHGNIRSYLHRFKIIDTPVCPCGTSDQTVEHFLFECEQLNKERDNLRHAIKDRSLANKQRQANTKIL
jgi:hypothetical protein